MMITEEYKSLLQQTHEDDSWGTTASKYAQEIKAFAESMCAKSVLDYGCGKGSLKKSLGDVVKEYDPAIPEKSARPSASDVVVCVDVLEHVEPEHLDAVIQDIHRLARYGVYLVIACYPARKILPDGRNAHLTVQKPAWWLNKLKHVTNHRVESGTLIVELRKQRQLPLWTKKYVFGQESWKDTARDKSVILCGGHPSIKDQAEAINDSNCVKAVINNTATIIKPTIWFGMDSPDNYDPSVLLDHGPMKIARLNYPSSTVLDKYWQDIPKTYFISDIGKEQGDWLNDGPLVWFKDTFKSSIQILYRMGYRNIFLAGCGFNQAGNYAYENTKDVTDQNTKLYSQTVDWLKNNQKYFLRNGLSVINCTPESRAVFLPWVSIDDIL